MDVLYNKKKGAETLVAVPRIVSSVRNDPKFKYLGPQSRSKPSHPPKSSSLDKIPIGAPRRNLRTIFTIHKTYVIMGL
jgi:hypothetical protein